MHPGSSIKLPYTIRVDTRGAAPTDMVPSRIQTHVFLPGKGFPATGTQQLNLDGPRVRLVFVGIALPRGRILGHTHVEGLQGVGPRRARRGVTAATLAVGREDAAQFKVCG